MTTCFVSLPLPSKSPATRSPLQTRMLESPTSVQRSTSGTRTAVIARSFAAVAAATAVAYAGDISVRTLSPQGPHPLRGVYAAQMRLPPIDRTNPNRCTPKSSAIGQANAARDSLLDLRECDLRELNLSGYDLSGSILESAQLDGADFTDAQLSKTYAVKASFRGSNFTNAIVDRVDFSGADLRGAVFANAVLSDSVFEGANLKDTDWSEAYVGDFLQRAICRNPTLAGENANGTPSRESLGCR